MTNQTLTAMFATRVEAERAKQQLVSDVHVDQAAIRTSPDAGMADAGYDKSRPYEEKGFFGSLKGMPVPEEDRYGYAEGMRRGSVLLSLQVEDGRLKQATDILERAGAMDLDAQEATWKREGWKGYDMAAHTAARGAPTTAAAATTAAAGQDGTIKVVEERLVVGKRAVEHGGMRVRAYVVERPVEEQVTLHQETVHVERHPVDRAATAADLNAFQERTIEARGVSEEAVVSKEARVIEEIGLSKESADRMETVHGTVRRTQVDVEDTTAGTAAPMDRALQANAGGNTPGASAPDGTPGNPPGSTLSRAVDKTLGTNISGANPGPKS